MPVLGRKLDYLFGLAGGNAHNVARSESMRAALQRIGMNDTPVIREFMTHHLTNVLLDLNNVALSDGARIVRESLLMGPAGGVKLQSTWEATKLITINVFGGK